MTLNDWKGVLLLQEVEALEDFGYTVEKYGDQEISRDEVFEMVQSGHVDIDQMEQSFTELIAFWKSIYLRK